MNCTTDLNQIKLCLNSSNQVLIYPTEAVFGIGCKANNFQAIKLIQKLKRRSPKKAFVVLAGNPQQLDYLINPHISKEIKSLVTLSNSLNYLSTKEFKSCLNQRELKLYLELEDILQKHKHLNNYIDDNCVNYTTDNYFQLAKSISKLLVFNQHLSISNTLNCTQKNINLSKFYSQVENDKTIEYKDIISLCLKLLTFYHSRAINITFILPCNPNIDIPVELLGLDHNSSLKEKQQATVAIRYTHVPSLLEITELADNIPLVSTSCNISGKDPLVTSQQIFNEFSNDELTKQICLLDKAITPTQDPCSNLIPNTYNYLKTSSPQNTSIIVDIFNLRVLRNGQFLKLQNGFKFINPQVYNQIQVLLSLCAYFKLELNLNN